LVADWTPLIGESATKAQVADSTPLIGESVTKAQVADSSCYSD